MIWFNHRSQVTARSSLSATILALLIVGGCSGKPAADKSGANADRLSTSAALDKDHQRCFQCDGVGHHACRAPGCKDGQIECPGSCLKLNRGSWEHMEVAGHPPTDVWQRFPNGPGKSTFWNQHHVGDVIVVQDGVAVNTGKCPRCGGTAKVKCPICDGRGQQTCELCEGKKIIPAAWTATNNPWLNRQPDLIRLKDGRALLGRVAMRTGAKCTLKTRDGKLVDVDAADILSKAAPAK